jgi:transposase InsO family protein
MRLRQKSMASGLSYLWTAIDVKTSEIITLDVSWLRNGDELIRVKQKVVLWCCLWYNWNRYHETLGGVPCLS